MKWELASKVGVVLADVLGNFVLILKLLEDERRPSRV
jgi:hypothetical protein